MRWSSTKCICKDKVKLVRWEDIESSGNVTQKMVEEIKSSKFGLCYLSEKINDDDLPFMDNDIVLFEAGMMHMMQDSKLLGWLPIRESNELSGPLPFDFAAEKMILIERNADGKIIIETLKLSLKNHLENVFAT